MQLRVSGDVDPKMGWFCDWADLDHWSGDVRTLLDHKTLNEVDGLENPTCENLARWIWDILKPRAPGLALVTVFEGPRSGVEYAG